MRRGKTFLSLAVVVVVLAGGIVLWKSGWWVVIRTKLVGKQTIQDRLNEFGKPARERLAPHFASANVKYPPTRILLLGLKSEKRLDVFAANADQPLAKICSYPIIAASGVAGPKLREGDRQVPEGFYKIESLNPNSRFHAALRVEYPSEFDRTMAAKDGRTTLGGDIMIHGSQGSVGCLAMGDPVAEELFTLAADVGIENIRVLVAPCDLRVSPRPQIENPPTWLSGMYDDVAAEMKNLPQ